MRLYKAPFKSNRRVICFDEFGPLEIRPHAGEGWHPKRQPKRLPASYTRPHGTRYLLAAYDIHADHMFGWQRPNQRWPEVLAFLKGIRRRYPIKVRLYIIMDNRGSHKKKEVRDWCKANRVTLVFTPTYASWLNRIEGHFAALRKFALKAHYYSDHKEQGLAIQKYLRWRNKEKRQPISYPREKRANLL